MSDIFSEVYGTYYNIVAKIIGQAVGGKLTLEQVYEYGKSIGEPKQTSGKQELYEAIVAMYS